MTLLSKKASGGDMAIAVFVDFENLALGFQGRNEKFDIKLVLKRLLEKGKIVAKKAYADWNRFSSYTGALHESAIELIEIPRRAQTGKNSADIRLVVDAMDLAYSKEHISTFVIVSGDSDFSPLVSKLKELGKHVIGLGMVESTSNLLRDNCDEFIYYEDLKSTREAGSAPLPQMPDTKRKALGLLLDAMAALRRENKDVMYSSMLKDTMRRIRPSFNETYHGYRTFSQLLEDAARQGLLTLETDKRSGTYVVTGIPGEAKRSPSNGPGSSQGNAGGPPPANTGPAMPSTSSAPNAAIAAYNQAALAGHDADDGGDGEAPSGEPPRRKSRRGGRGRSRGRNREQEGQGGGAAPPDSEGRTQEAPREPAPKAETPQPKPAAPAPRAAAASKPAPPAPVEKDGDRDDAPSDDGAKKKTRRGSRGGKGRTKKKAT